MQTEGWIAYGSQAVASTLETTQQAGVTVVRLRGSLAGEGTAQIAEAFERAVGEPAARVVVDLSGVDLVTTPALSMFVAAANRARDTGGRVVFTGAVPHVRGLLERLRLTLVLHTADGLEQGLAEAGA